MSAKNCVIADINKFFVDSMIALGPWERLRNLYKIRPKRAVPGEVQRLVFFTPNKMQENFWNSRTNRDLILKMRQGGVTTFSLLIALDMALWNSGVHTAIMAHKKENVKLFFRIAKTAFKAFQKDWGNLYPVSEKVDNVNELCIKENGSSLTVCTETKGLTLDFLHISEASFVPDDRISESLESVPLSGWIIMESTPDCAGGLFYELHDQSIRGNDCSFKSHFYPWWFQYPEEQDLVNLRPSADFRMSDKEIALQKEHDLGNEHFIWRRIKVSECGGDEGEFQRKYPEDPLTCFLSGANSVFSTGIMVSMWKNERPASFCGDLVIL